MIKMKLERLREIRRQLSRIEASIRDIHQAIGTLSVSASDGTVRTAQAEHTSDTHKKLELLDELRSNKHKRLSNEYAQLYLEIDMLLMSAELTPEQDITFREYYLRALYCPRTNVRRMHSHRTLAAKMGTTANCVEKRLKKTLEILC